MVGVKFEPRLLACRSTPSYPVSSLPLTSGWERTFRQASMRSKERRLEVRDWQIQCPLTIGARCLGKIRCLGLGCTRLSPMCSGIFRLGATWGLSLLVLYSAQRNKKFLSFLIPHGVTYPPSGMRALIKGFQ